MTLNDLKDGTLKAQFIRRYARTVWPTAI